MFALTEGTWWLLMTTYRMTYHISLDQAPLGLKIETNIFNCVVSSYLGSSVTVTCLLTHIVRCVAWGCQAFVSCGFFGKSKVCELELGIRMLRCVQQILWLLVREEWMLIQKDKYFVCMHDGFMMTIIVIYFHSKI